MKTYATKPNARRAAKHVLGEDAIEGKHYEIVDVGSDFGYQTLACVSARGAEVATPSDHLHLQTKLPKMTTKVRTAAPGLRHRSEVDNPVKLAWVIADSMPHASRKDAIAACVEQGIASFTARTQYQRWKSARAMMETRLTAE